MKVAIGIDLGASKAAIGLVNNKGEILETTRVPTGKDDPYPQVIDRIGDAILKLAKKSKTPVKYIGVGIAGQVDPEKGTIHHAPNLNWHHVPFVKDLEKKISLPVAITNDVRAITLGEWRFGAAKGCNDLVCIFIGTGIGGGVVSHGRLLTGHSQSFGEIGHMTVDMNGPTCACGNTGCIEAFAGGAALGQTTRDAIKNNPEKGKALLALADGNIDDVTAVTLSKAYQQSDPLAQEIVYCATHALAAGMVSIVNAFNPEIIILGGGVIEGFPHWLESVAQTIHSHALPSATSHLHLVLPHFGDEAGIVGAACLVL